MKKEKPPFNDWSVKTDLEKLRDFCKKLQDMADMEFGVDSDGDSAVEVELTDRTRYHRSHFNLVPYSDENGDGRKAAFDKATYNLSVAMESFNTENRIRQYHEDQEAKKAKEKK